MHLLRASLIGLVVAVACAPSPVRVGAEATRRDAAGDQGPEASIRPTPTVEIRTASPSVPTARPAGPAVLPESSLVPPTAPPPLLSAVPTASVPSPSSAAVPPDRSPEGTAASRQTATPAADPLTWKRYWAASGPVIYLPSTWKPLDPAIYASTTITFAGSPEDPSLPLDDHLVIVTLRVFERAVPLTTAAAFADALQQSVFAGVDVVRENGTHPVGPVVFLKYVEQRGSRPPVQEMDALFVVGGKGFVLGSRAPLDRWSQNSSLIRQIFDRFRPA